MVFCTRESVEDWNGCALAMTAPPSQTPGTTGASPNAMKLTPLLDEPPEEWLTTPEVLCWVSTLMVAPSAIRASWAACRGATSVPVPVPPS